MPSEAEVPTASEASEIALKFINHFFNNPGRDKPRASIPANPLRDDDLRLMAFIRSVTPPPTQGKETPCSNESQGGGCVKSSATTPDARTTSTPTAKSGTVTSGSVTDAASTSKPPPPPPACKPELWDGAEEVARKILDEYLGTTRGLPYAEDLLRQIITAAIRADREKQTARPNLNKVRELCNWCVAMHINTTHTRALAREVLAQLEGPSASSPT